MFRFLRTTISPTTPWPWLPLRFTSTTSSSSSSSSSSVSKGNSFVVSYLIDTLGFSHERAVTCSKHFSFENGEKPDMVIHFLENHCFSKTRALTVLRTVPLLLRANPHKSFQRKIDFFKSLGFSNSDISKIIVNSPHILTRSLDSEIIPNFDYFNNIFPSMQMLMKTIVRHPGILFGFEKVTAPNMKLMREEGIPESLIVRFLEYYPRTIKTSVKQFQKSVQEVKELGFDPSRFQFLVAVHVKSSMGNSLAKKESIYRKWGWTEDDLSAAFKICPWCIATSDNKIEAAMDFLVNKLGYTSSAVAKTPVVLTMSVGKRIIPRGSVILALMSRGLVNQLSLNAIYKTDEEAFLNKFVHRHAKEADELFRFYNASLALEQ